MKKLVTPIVTGMVVPNLMIPIVIVLNRMIRLNIRELIAFPEIIFGAFLISIWSAWFWRNSIINGYDLAMYGVADTFVGIGLSLLFFRGLTILVLLVYSPLLCIPVLLGAFTGWGMFKYPV